MGLKIIPWYKIKTLDEELKFELTAHIDTMNCSTRFQSYVRDNMNHESIFSSEIQYSFARNKLYERIFWYFVIKDCQNLNIFTFFNVKSPFRKAIQVWNVKIYWISTALSKNSKTIIIKLYKCRGGGRWKLVVCHYFYPFLKSGEAPGGTIYWFAKK